jgi:hypothetical protein
MVMPVAGCAGADVGSTTGGGGSGHNGGGSGGGGGSTGGGGNTGGGNTGGGNTGGGNTGGGNTGGGNTGGGNTGGGNTGGGTPVSIAGTYDVTTQFNLLDALPPAVDTAFSLVIELADSPGKFLLDVADRIPVVKYVIDAINLISGIRDQIIKAIDTYVDRWSGGLVTTLHGISQQLEMALRGLSMHSKLVLGAPDASGNVTVDDTLVDISFKWNGHDHPYPQNAHASSTAHVEGLKLTMAAHGYDRSLDFGAIIVDLVDNVALPELTGANSLGALANQLVNCTSVADSIWGYIGNFCIDPSNPKTCISNYISANDLAKLCVNTLNVAGDLVESQLAQLSSPGKLGAGEFACLAVENNGRTGRADSLTNGTWALSIPVASTAINLPGIFTGAVAK